MKKLFAAVLCAVCMSVTLPALAAADSPTNNATTTKVIGAVIGPVDVSGAQVQINCNGHITTTSASADGSYSATFSATDCPLYTWVAVTATKAGYSGMHSEPAIDFGSVNIADVVVTLSPTVAVPEMGVLTAVGATLAAAGGLLFVRRRAGGTTVA